MTLVVNKHTHTRTSNDVYIGRGSKWGNDFSHREGTKAQFVVGTVEEAVEQHRLSLWAQIKSGEITLVALAALDGKTLVCFCSSPDRPRPCHGHTLARAAAWAVGRLAEQRELAHMEAQYDADLALRFPQLYPDALDYQIGPDITPTLYR